MVGSRHQAMASTREVLVAVLVLVSVRASFTRALPALGADETGG